MMDNLAVQKDEIHVEKNEPNFIINQRLCKVLGNKNSLKENEVQKLIDIFQTNTISCIDLSNCHLLEFPLNFCSLDYITELNISANELKTLPDEFVNLKKLRVLNISNNLLREVPSVLYNGLHLVKFLNLSHNQINFMHKPPCCTAKLHHLDLSSNRLLEPPSWLLENVPSYLEYVDLSNNPCFEQHSEKKNISSEKKVAGSVKILKISNCKFREAVSCYLLNFSSLNILDFGNHEVKSQNLNYVSDIKFLPSSVEKLLMADVGLAGITNTLTDLPNLREMDISGNMIHWLPASIQNLSSLAILRAEACNLCLIPCEMNELVSLKELYLSSNQLTSTEGFELLVNLELLDLYGNHLISLPNLHKFSKLKSLDLCQNYVEPPSTIEINGLKYDYVDLKSNLRSKIKNSDRADGEKEFTTAPEDDISDEFIDSSVEEEFCDAESEEACVVVENENILDQSQDCWEQDENESFDPNAWTMKEVVHITRKESCESLMGEIPYEVTMHPHYFAPYQLVSPITLSKIILPPPVEGQFDD